MGHRGLMGSRRAGALVKGGAGFVLGAMFGGILSLGGAAAVTATVPAATYLDGPPPGFSGGFGEPSCHACHFDEDPNDGVGRLAIEGVPARYSVGESYPVTVMLTRPDLTAAGFQLTARFENSGAQAGILDPGSNAEDRTAVVTDRNIAYAYQLRAGSAPTAPDTARWTLLWTAPETGGVVRFHAAANAADGDDSVDGDFVYTVEVVAE